MQKPSGRLTYATYSRILRCLIVIAVAQLALLFVPHFIVVVLVSFALIGVTIGIETINESHMPWDEPNPTHSRRTLTMVTPAFVLLLMAAFSSLFLAMSVGLTFELVIELITAGRKIVGG